MGDLSFRVSSGLKDIIGRELITDKIVAIFELVKNSYDAGATRVDIIFNDIYSSDASIAISDNGSGMNKQDLIDKWLFVAYSDKKNTRSKKYIENLNSKRTYAGAKGIGRFSCDRLGVFLELYSKKENSKQTNLLIVDWNRFEKDAREEFINISVSHKYVNELPNKTKSGTTLVIKNLREQWNRDDILYLKKSLMKLINPHENQDDIFNIFLHCKDEENIDNKATTDREKINGKITNYIFESLNLKTTQISVSISENGDLITTKMQDRGLFLFQMQQKNSFRYLRNVMIELFYLNRKAKISFRKIMGIAPIEFGSIFVYKNGFRVMPYGEPNTDIFNIDRRKTQGYNRYLGTRDLMGRITISSNNSDFIETSSRDGGFIRTQAFDELKTFFSERVHKPLEKYTVQLIQWGDAIDDETEVVTLEQIKDKIIKYITDYEKNGQIISLEVNENLFGIIKENTEDKTSGLTSEVRDIALRNKDHVLLEIADRLEQQRRSLLKEKRELTKIVNETTHQLHARTEELQATKNQALFLKGLTNPKYENATESLHLMNTYAKSIKLNINKVMQVINKAGDTRLINELYNYIYEVVNATQKINATYTFAFTADYDIKEKEQVINIYTFICEYIHNALFAKTGEFIKININIKSSECYVKINPLELSMILENIIYNSYKAQATELEISISKNRKYIDIEFLDDGVGLNRNIENPNRIFELGFSTTGGTGVGLSYAKKTVEYWGGKISVSPVENRGFLLQMRLPNECRI
ncbi:sensor histidine kinase [Treponema sp. HNW]|uniref:ATP-binding protein n=1 Tax=Treponema sp. HNW TaxID=3116654 RepID=UPI003D14121B